MNQSLNIHRHYHWCLDWGTSIFALSITIGMLVMCIYGYYAALVPKFDKAMERHDAAIVEECARLRTRIRYLEILMEDRVKCIEVVQDVSDDDFSPTTIKIQ